MEKKERTEYLTIKLTQKEKEDVRKKAAENGLTISGYVRSNLLKLIKGGK